MFYKSFLTIIIFVLISTIASTTSSTSKKYNRFLIHIFNKYGNGATMSFEGLEHLMFNLGIGGLEFSPAHTIEEHRPNGFKLPDIIVDSDDNDEQKNNDSKKYNDDDDDDTDDIHENDVQFGFKEMHDPKHRHPRDHEHRKIPNVCLTPQAALKLVIDHDDIQSNYKTYRLKKRDIPSMVTTQLPLDLAVQKYSDHNREEDYIEFLNVVKITPKTFMKLCPALLVQLDQHLCMEDGTKAEILHSNHKNSQSLYYGKFGRFILSGKDFTIIFPAWIYASVAIFILSACGLCGVAMVPLMKSMAYKEILRFLVAVAVGTLAGDALMHLLPHALLESATSDEDAHHNGPILICACTFVTITFMYCIENLLPLITGRENGHGHSHGHSHGATQQQQNQANELHNHQHHQNVSNEVKEINTMMNENKKDRKMSDKPMTPVAFMVIIGDGLHNLTDGLAIGASFGADPVTGMATALAVLCHELPHELGDFALLLQTGMSIRRAIYLNIVSSVLSFMGMAFGLLIVDLHDNMTQWIYACTAGSFLYISMATLIPEMGSNDGKTMKNTIIQISGILVGGVIMLLIGLNEDRLKLLFE